VISEVEADIETEDEEYVSPWFYIKNILILIACCWSLAIGLAANGVTFAPLFGFSALFALIWLGRNHV